MLDDLAKVVSTQTTAMTTQEETLQQGQFRAL